MNKKPSGFETIDLSIVGCCTGHQRCWCPTEERVLRATEDRRYKEPFTATQREWCIDQILWADEGVWKREELVAMDDVKLAATTLNAWSQYAQANS
jgi:hypothetical protein